MLSYERALMGAGGLKQEPVYVEDVFSTWLYTGNNSTQTITNGIDLAGEGGMVWIKSRTTTASNALFDTERGALDYLTSNAANAASLLVNSLTSFNSDGFSIAQAGQTGTNAVNYTSWTFRKAPGFFDVVTYTGTGSARTVAHSLGSVPGTIIVKRTDTTADWQVYHRSIANTEYLVLNSAAAKATGTTRWNSTTPTSTVFSLGTDATVNASSATYVAYLFAHDEQIFGESGDQSVIKCGSYTGNGSTNGPVIDLGWEPQWVLIKAASAAGTWILFDSMRGIVTDYNDAYLIPNLTATENDLNQYLELNSTGFWIRNSSGAVNTSGQSYVYIAIRRGPMKKPESGAEVFGLNARTGTGAFATVTGGQLTDLLVIKNRAQTVGISPFWVARQTGRYYLTSVNTDAQVLGTTFFLQSRAWDIMDGVKVGDNSTAVNAAGSSFINYLFRRAPSFFDVVTYRGTGSARTVAHNLGVAPELMIVKRRNGLGGWPVYQSDIDATSYLSLNTANSAGSSIVVWNNTEPTATSFTVGTDISVNTSGGTYIAYLFATCPGVSKVGSYTGTGTTLNVDCGFTSGARFVLIKRTDSTGDWYAWDTARGIIAANDPYLLLNSSAAEVTSTDYIDPLSSGFQISSSAPAAINASGGSYIYFSVA